MMTDLLATTTMLAEVTPWFSNPGAVGGILGASIGVLGGGIYGPLVGVCASQGKARKLVMGYHFAMLGLGVVLLLVALYALIAGQPYGIWFGMLMPGALLVVLMIALTPMIRMRYREAEQRKLSAQEFRQG